MGQISFKIILVIPFFILLSLFFFVFYAYDIKFVNGKLSIKSNISKQIKSNLIGKQKPNFYLTSLGDHEALRKSILILQITSLLISGLVGVLLAEQNTTR